VEKILVIDVGTTRLKAAVLDGKGKILGFKSAYLSRSQTPTEQDPGQWYRSTLKLIKELNEKFNGDYDAIFVTGNMHALLPLDKTGCPMMNAWLWNDLRANQESKELNSKYEEEIFDRFYNPPIPGFPLTKLLYLKKHLPEIYNSIWKIVQPKDFIVYKLCGNIGTDLTDASGTLMFNMHKKRWDNEFLEKVGLSSTILPGINKSCEIVGTVREDVANLSGLLKGIPIVTGAGDLATASLGNGVNDSTFVMVIGTAGQIMTTSHSLNKELKGKIFAFCDVIPDSILYLGTIPAGGYSFEWFGNMNSLSKETVIEYANKARANTNIVYLPFILGTGTPYMIYKACGGFHYISTNDSLKEYCRAITEGIVFSLKESADIMSEHLGKRQRIVLQSLAARIPLIRNIVSTIFPYKTFIPETDESSIKGAAILGTVGISLYDSIPSAQKAMIRLKEFFSKGGDKCILMRFRKYQNVTRKLFLQGRD